MEMTARVLGPKVLAAFQDQIIAFAPASLPPNFDPATTTLDAAALVLCGLPPRPQEAAARAQWIAMLGPVATVTQATIKQVAIDMRLGGRRAEALDRDAQGEDLPLLDALPRGRLGSSRNWSGAAHLARRGERFTQVMAGWVAPAPAAGRGEGPFVCSVWIGVDGLRRWMTSMPQMGTAHVRGDTGLHKDVSFVWLQWWLYRRGVQAPVEIDVQGLAEGDPVHCCITLLPPGPATKGEADCVQFFVRAGRSTTAHVLVVRPPTDKQGRLVPARGASAQWIVERPTALQKSGNVDKDELFPLPNFGTCATTGFAALLARDPSLPAGGDGAPDGTQSTLRAARRLRMVERREVPRPSVAVIATPIAARGGTIAVRYKP